MTLADVPLPVEYRWANQHALVFGYALAQRLAEVQAEYGDNRHIPNPIMLSDGRFMLNADILTECIPGGLVYGGFSRLNAERFGEIEVIPIADAVSLVPPDPPMG